jgi:hypothetical protein
MRKDELVHLHSLLTVVRAEYERRGDASPSAFERYEELDVSPMAVYGSKSEHVRSVQALASALAVASPSQSPSTEERPAQQASENVESAVSDGRDEDAGRGERNVPVQS